MNISEYLDRYTSNTVCATSNQHIARYDTERSFTSRIFFKITHSGKYGYSFLFEDTVSGKYRRETLPNTTVGDWQITHAVLYRSSPLPTDEVLEDEFKACSNTLRVMTDDGSYGEHGNVTMPLKEMLENGEKFDMIITIGPLIMMKFVVATAKPFGTPVTASMNPIMIDGTGMCGGCRLTLNVDGKKVTKFACVDGPDFNGYEIDFDEAMSRGKMYGTFERHAYESTCNLYKKEVQ